MAGNEVAAHVLTDDSREKAKPSPPYVQLSAKTTIDGESFTEYSIAYVQSVCLFHPTCCQVPNA